MNKTILITFNNQTYLVAKNELVATIRNIRETEDMSNILCEQNYITQAINLLNEMVGMDENKGFAMNLASKNMVNTIPASELQEIFEAEPISIKNINMLHAIDFDCCYKLFNKDMMICGIVGESIITQTNEYIPVVVSDDGFKIAFNDIPDGFIHVSELAHAAVMKFEMDKVKADANEAAEMDKLMEEAEEKPIPRKACRAVDAVASKENKSLANDDDWDTIKGMIS